MLDKKGYAGTIMLNLSKAYDASNHELFSSET